MLGGCTSEGSQLLHTDVLGHPVAGGLSPGVSVSKNLPSSYCIETIIILENDLMVNWYCLCINY